MVKSTKRFAETYELLEEKSIVFKGHLWRKYHKVVVPLGPAKLCYSFDEEETKYLLIHFPNVLLVKWIDGFSSSNLCEECNVLY